MPPRRDPVPLEDSLAALNDSLQQILTTATISSSRLDTLTQVLSKQYDNQISRLGSIAAQVAKQKDTTANLDSALFKYDDVSSSATQTNPPPPLHGQPPPPPNGNPPPPPPYGRPPPNNDPFPTLRTPKIHFPTFDGTDPLVWVFQAEQYFQLHRVVPDNRLSIAVFYLKGDALSWYQYLYNNRLLTTWEAFTRALELRFGPSSFANHQAALFKLQKTGTVAEYHTDFEHIANRIVGLSPEALLNYFISGLKPEI